MEKGRLHKECFSPTASQSCQCFVCMASCPESSPGSFLYDQEILSFPFQALLFPLVPSAPFFSGTEPGPTEVWGVAGRAPIYIPPAPHTPKDSLEESWCDMLFFVLCDLLHGSLLLGCCFGLAFLRGRPFHCSVQVLGLSLGYQSFGLIFVILQAFGLGAFFLPKCSRVPRCR